MKRKYGSVVMKKERNLKLNEDKAHKTWCLWSRLDNNVVIVACGKLYFKFYLYISTVPTGF